MRDGCDPMLPEQLWQSHLGDRLLAPAGEHEPAIAAVAERSCRLKNLDGPPAQWDPVLALRLYPCGWNRGFRDLAVEDGAGLVARQEHGDAACGACA